MKTDEPIVFTTTRADFLTRETFLKLLSDAEIASVSNAETAQRLVDGDEFLDLGQIHRGVQFASAASADLGRVLPRKSVLASTWSRMLTVMAENGPAAPGLSEAK